MEVFAGECVHVRLTDGLRFEELGGAAFALALAVDGRNLHFVVGLRPQARDGHLTDGACREYETR